MKVRILRSFDCYEQGQVFEDWPDGMCELLIARGLIEQFKQPPAVEAAVEERDAETADLSPRRTNKRTR